MSLIDRHEDIVRILELRERVTVSELADRLAVSEVTVRKDLALLEEAGQFVRTRGGARVAQDRTLVLPIEARLSSLPLVKERIGRAAADLVREGDTVFIDSGSTCLAVARAVAAMTLRVVTNSLDVANALSRSSGVSIHLTGGSFRRDARSFIGPVAAETARRFHYDRAFLGASGVSLDGAFSSQNAIESDVKRAAVEQAHRAIVVTDATKVGRAAFSIFARADDVHTVIVDDDRTGSSALDELERRTRIEVIRVDPRRRRSRSIRAVATTR